MQRIKLSLPKILIILFITSGQVFSQPIPAQVIFSQDLREDIQISPDGDRVSYTSYDKNKLKNIFIKTIGKDDDNVILQENDGDILSYQWSYIPNNLLFFKNTEDKKAVHLYLIDISTGLLRDLTPFKGINARFILTDHRLPEEIICGIELNKKGRFDLYSINLKTGSIIEIAKIQEEIINLKGDIKNEAFIVETFDRMTMKRIFKIKSKNDDRFTELLTINIGEEFSILDFSEDGKSIYALSNKNNNFLALAKYDIEQKKEIETISVSPQYDIENIFFNHYYKKPIAVTYDFIRGEMAILDDQYKEDFQTLKKIKKGNITVLLCDRKDENWLISIEKSDIPASYHIYNRIQKKTTFLFRQKPELERFKSAKSQPFNIKSGKNEKLQLLITLPVEQNAENFPTILNLVNQDNRKIGQRFDPVCQFFSSRGFACVSFNYSGINGLGKEFNNKAYIREGIKRRTEEIVEVIKWSIEHNIAHPQQVIVISDSLNSFYVMNAIVKNTDIIHTAIFLDPVFDNKYLKENFNISEFNKSKDIIKIPSEEKKNIISNLNSFSLTSFFMLGKKSSLYNSSELIEILIGAKKQNKDINIYIYSSEEINNTIDFFQRLDPILGKYFNTDYIESKTEKKNEVEIR